MNLGNLQAGYDRVIVLPESPKDKTEGGIVLPENSKQKQKKGKVLRTACSDVPVNSIVYYPAYAGSEITVNVDGKVIDFLVLKSEDVLAIEG